MATKLYRIYEDTPLRLNMSLEQTRKRMSDIASGRYNTVGNGTSASYTHQWLPGKKHDMNNDITLFIIWCLLEAVPITRRTLIEKVKARYPGTSDKFLTDHIREFIKAFSSVSSA
jgi:hypothetical protein